MSDVSVHESGRTRAVSLGTRWLGLGLASVLAVVTLGLAITGRLGLYINPESAWWAVSMAIVVLVGAVASFTLPLGAEADHGHDHGHGTSAPHGSVAEPVEASFRGSTLRRAQGPGEDPVADRVEASSRGAALRRAQGPGEDSVAEPVEASSRGSALRRAQGPGEDHAHDHHRTHPLGLALTVTGGVVASAVVIATLVLPPATLSAELAMARDTGVPPLFAGADAVSLAATGDTASFGIGEWATVFATATNPEAFDGDTVQLTGFATPADVGDFTLTRLVISHCVIDAQPAGVPVAADISPPETGQWLQVTGVVRATSDGRLVIDASSVEEIDEPADPYEY